MSSDSKVIPTGLPSLDRLLGGGIPRRQSLVITGNPGTGKTVLCSQIAFAQAARGRQVVFATMASESHDKLLEELGGLSYYDADCIGNQIFVLSAYGAVKKGAKDGKELLLRSIRERKADLLCIDGMRSLRDLWNDEALLRDFLYEVNVGVAQLDAIAIFTTEYTADRLMDHAEATTVDGILALSTLRMAGRVVRRARVVKLRGRAHLTGEHVMHIASDGMRIVPRLEEVTRPADHFTPTDRRARFGLSELDRVLRGGLPEKSTTLLAGSTGVGKTLTALAFLAEGARAGEQGLLVSYSEPAERLIARAKSTAIDVEPLVESGRLRIQYRSPVDVEADDLIEELLAVTDESGAQRIVIDGVGDIEHSIMERDRARTMLTALIIQLRNRGVTSVFIKEIPKIAGTDVDFSDTPISVTAENLLFLRHVELRGRIHRVLSVLKMRQSDYDPYVREFVISESGIRVLDPMQAAEGLLTGAARVLAGGVHAP